MVHRLGSMLRSIYSKFFHPGLQGGGFQTQELCRTAPSAHLTICRFEGFNDMSLFNITHGANLSFHIFLLSRFYLNMFLIDGSAPAQNYRPFDNILEFSYIPRPGIVFQSLHRPVGEYTRRPSQPGTYPSDKIIGKKGYIFHTFSQRWKRDRKDIQPVKQVLTEFILFHHLFEIPMRRGNDPCIDLDRPGPAHPFKGLFLQHPQEFSLGLKWEISDLIQEDGSPVRKFKAPLFLRDRPGKGPLLVSEQLALDQAGWNCGAVQLDHGLGASRAQMMDGSADQLLPGSCLTVNQDCGIGRRNRGDLFQHILDRIAPPDNLLIIVFGFDLIGECLLRLDPSL